MYFHHFWIFIPVFHAQIIHWTRTWLLFLQGLQEFTYSFIITLLIERCKNNSFEPRYIPSTKIGQMGFISPKRAVKLRLDSRIFSGLLSVILGKQELSSRHHCVKISTPLRKMYRCQVKCWLLIVVSCRIEGAVSSKTVTICCKDVKIIYFD